MISPSIPMFHGSIYLQGCTSDMFDNRSMLLRYSQSDIAKDISQQISETDKLNFVDRNKQKPHLTAKFERLSNSLNNAIKYADEEIRLTDISRCMLTEFCGPPLGGLYKRSFIYKGDHSLLNKAGLFSKLMFDYVYTLYCMNSRLKVIHGDLHVNNVTFHSIHKRPYVSNTFSHAHVIYEINEEMFAFPYDGTVGVIIDYSRSIICDYVAIERDHGAIIADMMHTGQQHRILQIIARAFTDFATSHQTELRYSVMNQQELLFKIATICDTFVLMDGFYLQMSQTKLRNGELLAEKHLNLIKSLRDKCESLFMGNMEGLLTKKYTSEDDIEWPNLVLIKDIFTIFKRDTIASDIEIVDYFRSTNPLKYDYADELEWSPVMKKIFENRGWEKGSTVGILNIVDKSIQ